MIRRVLVTLAAFAVGMVALGPAGEVLFYGLESFPAEADAKGVMRVVSATGAVVLLLVGAAAAAQVRGRARGWPLVAAGLLVGGLLATYAPLDAASALGELHPLVRLVAALVGGVVLGAAIVAVLPADPAGGDPWPIAAFTAGALVGLPLAPDLLPSLPELRRLDWADVAALVLAVVAAIVVRSAEGGRMPGLAAVSRIALLGALAGAAFHMQYVDRAMDGAPSAVAVLVLLLTLAVWVALTWWLVGWSGRVAGAEAARFALTCAGATGAMFVASGRNLNVVWAHDLVPLLGIAAAVAGVLLARHLPAVPWDAAGLAAVAVAALLIATAQTEIVALAIVGLAVAAFALGAALARTSSAGALCGLVTLVLTVPVLFSLLSQLGWLVADPRAETTPARFQLAVLYAPMWLVGLATAALLVWRARPARSAPTPLAVG
ncbi:hypothetical protein SAMN05421812_1048 [Asanoa hainanensis]|uniref:Uncharacterized protein n=1 Tax=Asanoa hainanensis TaxID=560556 RepID=A0A239L4R5_9ACTN|nr:hypothetical protein [Asanoa hainanensis]SNT24908.1 hypothetical protein SAMN05421812_1048 [Asanoa hainanensis]